MKKYYETKRGRSGRIQRRKAKSEPMEKVEDLKVHYKIRERWNGKKNLLGREVIILDVAILVTLRIIMVVRKKRNFGLRKLVSCV